MIISMISGITGGIIVILACHLWQNYRSKQAEDETNELTATDAAESASPKTKTCKDIVLDALRQLQCEPQVEDRGEGLHTIYFDYQSEHFSINVSSTSRFATIYDAFWFSFEANDLEQLSNIKNIINDINWSSSLNVCYNKTDENNMFNIHTTYTMLCLEEGDFTAYLRHILRECFVVHNNFFKQAIEASVTNKD